MAKNNDKTALPELLPGFCQTSKQTAEAMRAEEAIREKTDEHGVVWSKAYFGSGAHLKNWLAQVKEIFGEGNVMVEPVEFTELACFTEPENRACRIWVRKKSEG